MPKACSSSCRNRGRNQSRAMSVSFAYRVSSVTVAVVSDRPASKYGRVALVLVVAGGSPKLQGCCGAPVTVLGNPLIDVSGNAIWRSRYQHLSIDGKG